MIFAGRLRFFTEDKMSRVTLSIAAAVMLVLTGCEFYMPGGASHTESLITPGSNRDFGLTGSWVSSSDSERIAPNEQVVIKITGEKDYRVSVASAAEPFEQSQVAKFRVTEVSPESSYAIVEVDWILPNTKPVRKLGYFEVRKDELYLWTVDGRKLGEHLFNDGVNAVVEHTGSSSLIRCDQGKLLETLKQHSREIVHPPKRFKRKSGLRSSHEVYNQAIALLHCGHRSVVGMAGTSRDGI